MKTHPTETMFARRARILRVPVCQIASLSGTNVETVRMVLRGTSDSKRSTLEAIEAALVAEERRLLAHLIALHPDMAAQRSSPVSVTAGQMTAGQVPADQIRADHVPAGLAA
jgi:hypothetical protein